MSISLNGLKPKDTYQALIKVGDNTIVTTVNKTLSDGQGNDLPMQVSTTEINFTGLVKQSGITLATTTQLNLKQDILVSGTNIKTVNGSSVLGSGNLVVSSSAIWGGIVGTLSSQTDLQTALNTKVNGNTAIVGATKTIITYDAKGLVTAGADATTLDIADALNKRYVTDANLVVIGNTSGTNSGDNATNTQYSGLAASKQNTLVSGTNIKTINSTSLLGSGDIVIATPPSGINGAIQFSNGSAFSSDASNFFWDNTNKRLGIGTNVPTATLGIKGIGSTSATTSLLIQNSTGNNSITTTDDGSTIIYSNLSSSTAPLIVNNQSGWSGAYTQRLQTWRSAGVDKCWISGAGSMVISEGCQALTFTSAQPSSVGDVAYRGSGQGAGNGLYFPTANATGIATNGIERMRVNASGNVGIGESSPTARLQVKGSGSTSATSTLKLENSTASRSLLMLDSGDVTFYNSVTQKMAIIGYESALTFQSSSGNIITENGIQFQSGGGQLFDGTLYLSSANYTHLFRKNIQLDGTITPNTAFQTVFNDGGGTFTNTYRMVNITPTIVLSGGGAKNVVGLTFNPTLTSTTNTRVFGAVFESGNMLIGGVASSGNASASLEVISTTQGLLPPRMTTIQKTAIVTPASGLIVYDTTTNKLCCYNGTIWNDLF
jgi:hypothetical protein